MNPGSVTSRLQISNRVRDVRDSWSPSERRRRAVQGRTRFEQFVDLISHPGNDSEIWAAGALTAVDLERLIHAS
jgi:hypothetical protein